MVNDMSKWFPVNVGLRLGSVRSPWLFNVVVVPQQLCPSKPAPLRKSKQLAGECHRSSGLLMLCCVLMCMSAGQWVIMCVRLLVPVLQCADFVDGIIYSLSVS